MRGHRPRVRGRGRSLHHNQPGKPQRLGQMFGRGDGCDLGPILRSSAVAPAHERLRKHAAQFNGIGGG